MQQHPIGITLLALIYIRPSDASCQEGGSLL